MSEETKQQVMDQCRVVSHLATAIAEVYEDLSKRVPDILMKQIGQRTAGLMERLGDILNGMDANTPEDGWMNPIFEKAHKMFPQPPQNGEPEYDEEGNELQACEACLKSVRIDNMHISQDDGWFCPECIAAWQEEEQNQSKDTTPSDQHSRKDNP